MEEFVIRLLVNKNKVGVQFFVGDVVSGYIDSYYKKMRIKQNGYSPVMLEHDEYEVLIDDRDFNQLLYCT